MTAPAERVQVVEGPGELAEAAARAAMADLEAAVEAHGTATWVLTGGSTPAAAYRRLAAHDLRTGIEWDRGRAEVRRQAVGTIRRSACDERRTTPSDRARGCPRAHLPRPDHEDRTGRSTTLGRAVQRHVGERDGRSWTPRTSDPARPERKREQPIERGRERVVQPGPRDRLAHLVKELVLGHDRRLEADPQRDRSPNRFLGQEESHPGG